MVRAGPANRLKDDLIEALDRMPTRKRKRADNPWNGWSASKRQEYAFSLYNRFLPPFRFCRFLAELSRPGNSYKYMALKYGRQCPSRSTVRDWLVRYKSGAEIGRVGRPGLLSPSEQGVLVDAVRTVRQCGGVIDIASLMYMGEELLQRARPADRVSLTRDWARYLSCT